MTITTQAVREMAERLGSWSGLVSSGYECPAAGTAMHEAQTMLLALVEERDRLAAQIAFYEQLTETRNGEVRHLTDRAEAAEKMLAAVRDDAMKADNLLCAMEARAEAAEAALRSCIDSLHSEVLQKYGGQKPDDMHPVTRRAYDRDMAEIEGYRAALQGRDGDG